MRYSKKFSFAELTSNSSGKTSGSGTAGLFIVLIGGLSFITGVILIALNIDEKDILIQSIALVYAGAALLGVRKLSKANNYEQLPRDDSSVGGESQATGRGSESKELPKTDYPT